MKILLSSFLLIFAFQLNFGQKPSTENNLIIWDNGVFHSSWQFFHNSDSEIEEIKRRWNEIGESFKTTTNLFAGTYYQSGNRGYYLRWSPEKGFIYVQYYDQSLIGDVSWGSAIVSDSEIIFKTEKELKQNNFNKKLITPSKWIPAFNNQQFFIRKDAIKSFGDFYGGFGDFNGFPLNWYCECSAFARRVDKNVDTSKLKDFIVPAKYLKFIKYPISGKIILVGKPYISTHSLVYDSETDNKASITPVTINLGRHSGIKRGLLFFTENSYLEVKKVGNKTSQAIIFRSVDNNGKEGYYDTWDEKSRKTIYKTYPPIRVGERISTVEFNNHTVNAL